MIYLDGISKQNGHQILFIEASAAFHKGEKVGLVGPNGAGKTTLFRLITGEEQPDEGQMSVRRGVTIGYFSQDVGEMSGCRPWELWTAQARSASRPPVAELEAAMGDPEAGGRMEAPSSATARFRAVSRN